MPTYLDHNATTPMDSRVVDAMLPYLGGPAGNASSLHRFGRMARDAVEHARAQVAALIGCQASEIIWTSGGTEANNLAIKGMAASLTAERILYGATDHPAVMETAESLAGQDTQVEAIKMNGDGLIDFASFERQLEQGPVDLVSVMRANNETGVIQDVKSIARRAQAAGALVHVDAVQACGKIPLDMAALDADLVSVSAHKINGPKGAGALILRSHVDLFPTQHGGAQERKLRGGTENVAAIVGFGEAAEIAKAELSSRAEHCLALRGALEQQLAAFPAATIFGAGAPERLPNTVQFGIQGWDGEALLMALDRAGYAVSSGSACASGSGEPSHVLLAMGYEPDVAKSAIRVSFGQGNTVEEVQGFITALKQIVAGNGA